MNTLLISFQRIGALIGALITGCKLFSCPNFSFHHYRIYTICTMCLYLFILLIAWKAWLKMHVGSWSFTNIILFKQSSHNIFLYVAGLLLASENLYRWYLFWIRLIISRVKLTFLGLYPAQGSIVWFLGTLLVVPRNRTRSISRMYDHYIAHLKRSID